MATGKYKYSLNAATKRFLKMYHAPKKRAPVVTLEEKRAGYSGLLKNFGLKLSADVKANVRTERIAVPSRSNKRDIPCIAYFPQTHEGRLPIMLYAHGGGWTLGTPLDYHNFLQTCCRKIGAVCVSVDYRLSPEHKFPAAIEDFYDVFEWVASGRSSSTLHHLVDNESIALAGDSAGGNIAAVCSLMARDSIYARNIKVQAPLCGAFDLSNMSTKSHAAFGSDYFLTSEAMLEFRDNYTSSNAPEIWDDWRVSPIKASSFDNLPPAWIAVASHDPLISEGVAYGKALQRSANNSDDAVVKTYPGMHIFWMLEGVAGTADCHAFLDDFSNAMKQRLFATSQQSRL